MPGFFEIIKKPFMVRRLKQEYKLLYGSSPTAAEQSLQRQIAKLKTKQPGKSEEWYLQKNHLRSGEGPETRKVVNAPLIRLSKVRLLILLPMDA